MTHLSTHVLDATTGTPAAGVPVVLTDPAGTVLADAHTDADGRISDLYTGPATGVLRLRFDTATYFTARGVRSFYPEVVVAFEVAADGDAGGRHHVPLLLSPFAYSTYRGS